MSPDDQQVNSLRQFVQPPGGEVLAPPLAIEPDVI